jgi:hypothetical protein
MGVLLESNGWKRSIGLIFLLAAKIPQLAPYAEALDFLGGLFGITGLAHAAIASGLKS